MPNIMNQLPKLSTIKDTIQDSNLNFLIGSGLSANYLSPLANIESLLTDLASKDDLESNKRKIIECSIYKHYFDQVMLRNLDVLDNHPDASEVLNNYKSFLKTINTLILLRKSTILSKQINLFTTNVDVFLEKALDETRLEFNDGFSGCFTPQFDLSNFKKLLYKTSLHYDNRAAIPVFNLMKLHGSLTWHLHEQEIKFASRIEAVKSLSEVSIPSDKLIAITNDSTIDTMIPACDGLTLDDSLTSFIRAYDQLSIVNPTKEKLSLSLLNQTYYELLRFYSNELEKESTILFVLGFSFRDEHIRDITLRAANSNPTLIIYVIAHSHKSCDEIKDRLRIDSLKYNNIKIVEPTQTDGRDDFKYDFKKINNDLFLKLLDNEGNVAVS